MYIVMKAVVIGRRGVSARGVEASARHRFRRAMAGKRWRRSLHSIKAPSSEIMLGA